MSELVLYTLYLDIHAVLSGDAVKKSENDECNDKSWNFEAIVGEKDVRSDRLTFQLPRQLDTIWYSTYWLYHFCRLTKDAWLIIQYRTSDLKASQCWRLSPQDPHPLHAQQLEQNHGLLLMTDFKDGSHWSIHHFVSPWSVSSMMMNLNVVMVFLWTDTVYQIFCQETSFFQPYRGLYQGSLSPEIRIYYARTAFQWTKQG